MRLMGIDYGKKRIGIAVSDESGGFAFAPGQSLVQGFAFPYGVIQNDRNTVKKIKKICQEKNVSKIILGESLDYAGRPNPIMEKIEPFKKSLEKEIGLAVEYQGEILTTQEAMRLPFRKGRQKTEKTDASAAALILKSYLEKQK